jgi:hypothetical protein
VVTAEVKNEKLLPESRRCGLHVSSLSLGLNGIRTHEHADCRRVRYQLAKQRQALRSQFAGIATTAATPKRVSMRINAMNG